MWSSDVVNTTLAVESTYFVLLEEKHLVAKQPPEMTSRSLRDVTYVTSDNASGLYPMLDYPGNYSNASFMLAPTFNEVSLMKAVVFGVMFFISLIGNTATLMQMYRLRRRKSTINTLIVQLAIADLLVTFFCIAGEAVWAGTVQWLAGNITCKIVKYMQVFALYLSTYITIAISLDRCVAILDPMRRQGASQRVRVMIILSWVCSALFSIPQAVVFHVLKGPFEVEFYQCVTFGSYREDWQRQLYSVASLLLMFVLPLVIIGTAYALIFTTISRKSREVSVLDSMSGMSYKPWVILWHTYRRACLCGDSCDRPLSREESIVSRCSGEYGRGPVRSNLLRRAKRKSLRMSVFIVLAFIVCWSPYYIIFTVCVTFLDWKEIDPKTLLWFSFIGLSNSMLNPIIYGAFQLCKVHRHRSWRRDEWPASSLKILGCGQRGSAYPLLAQQRQQDTRANALGSASASGSGSGGSSGSRGRLLPLCRCDVCLQDRRHQQQLMMSPMTQESGLQAAGTGGGAGGGGGGVDGDGNDGGGIGCDGTTAGGAAVGSEMNPTNQRCIRFSHKHFVSGESRRCSMFHSY